VLEEDLEAWKLHKARHIPRFNEHQLLRVLEFIIGDNGS
jgi:hypothetical protein